MRLWDISLALVSVVRHRGFKGGPKKSFSIDILSYPFRSNNLLGDFSDKVEGGTTTPDLARFAYGNCV